MLRRERIQELHRLRAERGMHPKEAYELVCLEKDELNALWAVFDVADMMSSAWPSNSGMPQVRIVIDSYYREGQG